MFRSIPYHDRKPIRFAHSLCQQHCRLVVRIEFVHLPADEVLDPLEQLHIVPESTEYRALSCYPVL